MLSTEKGDIILYNYANNAGGPQKPCNYHFKEIEKRKQMRLVDV